MSKPATHLPALDGLRGVAILLVVIRHLALEFEPQSSMGRLLAAGGLMGWMGVDLFFVLSGFLITGILVDAKGGRHYFSSFYARRVLRIFPLYYGFLLGLLLLNPIANGWAPTVWAESERFRGNQFWYWTYLTNFLGVMGRPRPLNTAHFWSLAVEEQFYLVWPVVVLLSSRRGLARICAGCIGLSLLFRIGVVVLGGGHAAAYALTPGRMDALAIGGLLALGMRGEGALERFRSRSLAWLGATALLVLALFVWRGTRDAEDLVISTVGLSVIAFCFGALLYQVLISSPGSLLQRTLETPLLKRFGLYSYAVYVFHYPMLWFLGFKHFEPLLPELGRWRAPVQLLHGIAFIGLCLGVGWLSWHLYEKHFLRLKDRFPMPRRIER